MLSLYWKYMMKSQMIKFIKEQIRQAVISRRDISVYNRNDNKMRYLLIKTVIILIVSGFSTVNVLRCYASGTTGAEFLKIGTGARAVGMGEAFTGLADDINAITYNPAGLDTLEANEIMLMHNEWIQGIKMEYFAFSCKEGSIGTFGLSGALVLAGDMEKYDNQGNDLNEKYTAMDSVVTLTYSKDVKKIISVGINVKYIRQQIEREHAEGLCMDMGILFRGITISDKILSIGFVMQNMGEDIKFMSESDKLPQTMKLGISYPLMEEPRSRLICNVDMSRSMENAGYEDILMNYGAEYSYGITKDIGFTGRGGYKTGVKELGELAGITAGIGLKLSSYSIDYCFMPLGDLDETHRVSLSIKY